MTMKLRAEAPVRLRLYIAGDSPAMQDALACREVLLRRLAAQGEIEIAVIDILEDPEAARSAGILATPTLSDDTRSPPQRLAGDLGNPGHILDHFALHGTGAAS